MAEEQDSYCNTSVISRQTPKFHDSLYQIEAFPDSFQNNSNKPPVHYKPGNLKINAPLPKYKQNKSPSPLMVSLTNRDSNKLNQAIFEEQNELSLEKAALHQRKKKACIIGTIILCAIIILAAIIFFTLIFCTKKKDNPVKPIYPGGNGTKQNPYQIENATHFGYIAQNLSSYFVLNNDIDFNDTSVIIGSISEPFTGSIDGKGFKLKKLSIYNTKKAQNQEETNSCLFPMIKFGNITNLEISDSLVRGYDNCAILACYASTATLKNISLKSIKIHAESNNSNQLQNMEKVLNADLNDYLGGLVGKAELSIFENIFSEDTTIQGSSSAASATGGIVGYCRECLINNISGIASILYADTNVGGIVGRLNLSTIYNISFKTLISGVNSFAGGVVGYMFDSQISKINLTYVSISPINILQKIESVGGVVGLMSGSNISECVVSNEFYIKGNECGGGIVGTIRFRFSVGKQLGSKIVNCDVKDLLLTGDISKTGGIVGCASREKILIENVTIEATFQNQINYTGGVAGYSEFVNLTSRNISTFITFESINHCGGSFGFIKKATFLNFENIISGGKISCSYSCGGFAGEILDSPGKITNCHSHSLIEGYFLIGGFIASTDSSLYISESTSSSSIDINWANSVGNIGGFIGISTNKLATIYQCKSTSQFNFQSISNSSELKNFGGLMGYSDSQLNQSISKIYFSDKNIPKMNNSGGLVGFASNSSSIINSYSKCNASGDFNVGGLIGLNYGNVTNCFSAGEVSYSDWATAGGLIGNSSDEATITNSFYDGSISVINKSDGGTSLTTQQMGDKKSFQKWDFDNIWKMGSAYPMLAWETFTN